MPSVELPLGDTLRAFSDLSDIDYHEQLLLGGKQPARTVFGKAQAWRVINSLFVPLPHNCAFPPIWGVVLASVCPVVCWCPERSSRQRCDQRFGSVLWRSSPNFSTYLGIRIPWLKNQSRKDPPLRSTDSELKVFIPNHVSAIGAKSFFFFLF